MAYGQKLIEIAFLFFKLGWIAFGGPAAHIAMMEEEVVSRRQWLSRQHFLDLVGATNLIPGPNSTQMVMHCGYERGGVAGLLLAGVAFILPATLITGILAFVYVKYQSLPALSAFFYGIKPAVLAIILGAVYKLGKKALKGWQLGVIGAAVATASLAGVNEVIAILIGGLVGVLWLRFHRTIDSSDKMSGFLFPWLIVVKMKNKGLALAGATLGASTAGVSLAALFLVFVKIAVVLFGSGYVLIAYLEGELVQSLGWLTESELLDAVAIGQFTPGPVLSTATFIGYLIEGLPGAAVATFGIFLPSFILVALLNPVIPRLRKSHLASLFLDAINISAVGIMAAVTLELGYSMLSQWQAWIIFIASVATTFGFKKVSPVWIVLGGAALGYLLVQAV